MSKFTKSDLKHSVTNTGSFFFDRKSMQFFGDSMANYGLRSCNAQTWELYRKNPVKHGLKESTYFDKATYERVFLNDKKVGN